MCGLHFPTTDIGLSSLKFFCWVPEFLFTSARGRFGRLRASKVTDLGANQKRICNFLLVRNSNLSCTVSDLQQVLCAPDPPLFNPNFGDVPVAPDRPCWASTSAWALSYSAVKLFSKNSNLCDHGT